MNKISSKRSMGVGMVEILITLLIVSIGYMGIAGLETSAKKANFDAMQRTSAVMLGHDIVERMRANPVILASYLTPVAGLGGGSLTQPSQTCSSTSKCNSGQMAAYDMWLWEQAMDGANEIRSLNSVSTKTGGLVNPTACITGPTSGAAGVYTITIVWRGLNDLTNVSANTCGTGVAKYGASDEFRRILSFDTYISP